MGIKQEQVLSLEPSSQLRFKGIDESLGLVLVLRGHTAFSHFSLGWRDKGLVWFTVTTRLDTSGSDNKFASPMNAFVIQDVS